MKIVHIRKIQGRQERTKRIFGDASRVRRMLFSVMPNLTGLVGTNRAHDLSRLITEDVPGMLEAITELKNVRNHLQRRVIELEDTYEPGQHAHDRAWLKDRLPTLDTNTNAITVRQITGEPMTVLINGKMIALPTGATVHVKLDGDETTHVSKDAYEDVLSGKDYNIPHYGE